MWRLLSTACTAKPCKPFVSLWFHCQWNHRDCTASILTHCPFKARAKVYKPSLSPLISLSLISLSHCLLLLSLSSITSLTSLHILLTIFNTPHVINMLRTVRFLFTVVHATLATYTKLKWLVSHMLSFSQSVHMMYGTYTKLNYCPVWGSLRLAPINICMHTTVKHTTQYHGNTEHVNGLDFTVYA